MARRQNTKPTVKGLQLIVKEEEEEEEMFDDNLFHDQTPPPNSFCNCLKEKKITPKIWCTDCDQWLIDSGVALDHPTDGTFYVCPVCKHRVVLFLE